MLVIVKALVSKKQLAVPLPLAARRGKQTSPGHRACAVSLKVPPGLHFCRYSVAILPEPSGGDICGCFGLQSCTAFFIQCPCLLEHPWDHSPALPLQEGEQHAKRKAGFSKFKKKKKIIQQQRKNKLNNLHLLDKQLVRSQGISVSFLQSFPQFFFFFCKDAVCLCLSFFPFVLLRLSSLCFGKQTRDSYLKHHFFIQKLKSSCLNSALLAL